MDAIDGGFNEWTEVCDSLCCLRLPTNPRLGLQEVHVWRASLFLDHSRLKDLARLLSLDEKLRTEKFRAQETIDRFIAARGTLRWILANYLEEDPAAIRFRYCPHGKPAIYRQSVPHTLHFNLSHSEDFALYAITRNQRVGIDLERVVPLADQDDIARRFFSVREATVLAGLSIEDKARTFYTYWTRKEAYAKAIGLGLSLPFDDFDVSMDMWNQPVLVTHASDCPRKSSWYLQDVSLGTCFVASLVVEGRIGPKKIL